MKIFAIASSLNLASCATINTSEPESAPPRPDIYWMHIVANECLDEGTPVVIALTPEELEKLLTYIFQLEDRLK